MHWSLCGGLLPPHSRPIPSPTCPLILPPPHTTTTSTPPIIPAGNICLSVLAEALLLRTLASLPTPLDIVVESASIGAGPPGPHDARVARVAQEAGVALAPRQARRFNEVGAVGVDG